MRTRAFHLCFASRALIFRFERFCQTQAPETFFRLRIPMNPMQ
jgi:hypothetical protein